MSTAWTIPFDGTNYVCWRDKQNKPHSRPLSPDEERAYFGSSDKDKFLNDLLNK